VTTATYLVAYSADSGGRGALAVGRLLGSSGGVRLLVCTIVPETWGYPSMARVDAEYAEFLDTYASKALDEARAALGDSVDAEYRAHAAGSPTEGLLELAAESEVSMVILGSSRSGPVGRFAVGSVTNSLLHSAPVPVALAPRGYRTSRQAQLRRVTCGYVGTSRSAGTLGAAKALAARHGVSLRLITAVVRDRQMYPPLVGWQSERLVEEQWRSEAREAQQQALAGLAGEIEVSAAIVDGANWDDALDSVEWEDGEILVIGSSRLGAGERIFLGANASKIVRSSPVPVVVVPVSPGAPGAPGAPS
jgi:nucleotide-binding universal stress UspA family protein